MNCQECKGQPARYCYPIRMKADGLNVECSNGSKPVFYKDPKKKSSEFKTNK